MESTKDDGPERAGQVEAPQPAEEAPPASEPIAFGRYNGEWRIRQVVAPRASARATVRRTPTMRPVF